MRELLVEELSAVSGAGPRGGDGPGPAEIAAIQAAANEMLNQNDLVYVGQEGGTVTFQDGNGNFIQIEGEELDHYMDQETSD